MNYTVNHFVKLHNDKLIPLINKHQKLQSKQLRYSEY